MIRQHLGIEPELKVGRPGQLDVVVDGETLNATATGFWARLLNGGRPDERVVVEQLKARQQARKETAQT